MFFAVILNKHPVISLLTAKNMQQVIKMEECSRKRQFVRVNIQRDVQLDFGARKYSPPLSNLSLGGMYVRGIADQRPGDSCTINLRRSESDSEEIMATGSVVRVGDDGVAIKFTSMGIDSFLFLQTALLHEACDSSVLGEKPVEYMILGISTHQSVPHIERTVSKQKEAVQFSLQSDRRRLQYEINNC